MLVATVTRKHIQARLRYMIKCHEKEVREKKVREKEVREKKVREKKVMVKEVRENKRLKRRLIQEQVESTLFSQSISIELLLSDENTSE